MATVTRKIVKIDEDKCNGCGECIPNCAEGAIQIIDGKAKLLGENLCDGLGACLGTCPMDAITVEERTAEEFDEAAVEKHLGQTTCDCGHGEAAPATPPAGGCPGAQLMMLGKKPTASPAAQTGDRPSQLGQWPVQLALVPPAGDIWTDADVLIAADCVPFAMADFHEKLLTGKTLAIACPKLDDIEPYITKLTAIFANNSIKSITVAHMEVPCCGGIVYAVQQAIEASGRTDIPVRDVTIGIGGEILTEA